MNDKLSELCKPLIEYLKSKGSPYYTLIIKENEIRLVCDEIFIPIKND